jgi:RNA polymerase sigma-70 factor, ECF subfamily
VVVKLVIIGLKITLRTDIKMTLSSDQSLVLRLRSGDESAASEVYNRYANRVFGLVHQQMTDRLRAQIQPEDIVQSVFKSVFRGISLGSYEAPEGGTLWQLMAIVAVHKVRRNARRRTALRRDARRTQSLDAMEHFDTADDFTPEEFESAIREAIEDLKETEKDVVLLRVQGYSVEEIATKLDRSRRSIERTLQNIRTKMLSSFDEEEADTIS